MSKLEIVKEPAAILRQKAKKVGKITPQLAQLIEDMGQTMSEVEGMGLAAPQVGHGIRLCVINFDDGFLTLINPVILYRSWRKETEDEGCLSCPGKWLPVKRSKTLLVTAKNAENKRIFFKANGLFARVIQHETDHLNGVLIIDKK